MGESVIMPEQILSVQIGDQIKFEENFVFRFSDLLPFYYNYYNMKLYYYNSY